GTASQPGDAASGRLFTGETHGCRQHRQGEDRRRLPAWRERHRLARGPGRAAHRSHRRADRSLQGPREGPPLAPRPAQDGQPPPQAARYTEGDHPFELQGADRATRSARLTERTRNPQANLAGFLFWTADRRTAPPD